MVFAWAAISSTRDRRVMSTTARTPAEAAAVDRRRLALTAMCALAGAAVLLSLTDAHVGPAWVHWVCSLVALIAALGVVVVAELNWQRAVSSATAVGLVARSRSVVADPDGGDSVRMPS
jgi:hypothetical protein